jgi:hypothetical protein
MFGSELLFNAFLPTHTFLPFSSVCGNFILLITNYLFLYFHTSEITAILICPESVKLFWFGAVTFQAGNTDCFPPPGAVPGWCLVVTQPRNSPSTGHCLWMSTYFPPFSLPSYSRVSCLWHSNDPILLINKVYRLCQQTD